MEKVIYVLWRDPRVEIEEWSQLLREELSEKLLELGVKELQINVADKAVQAAVPLTQVATRPQMEAFVQIWLPCAMASFRQSIDDLVASAAWRMAAYLVTESQPIVNNRHRVSHGQRTPGFSQMAVLKCPFRLSHEAWLDLWQNGHTQIAVDTQDNFQYTQNLVVRRLCHDSPSYDAIVEECFESEAMTDPHAFFNTGGDENKLKQHYRLMMESCDRFIDRDKIDVVPTSQYIIATTS